MAPGGEEKIDGALGSIGATGTLNIVHVNGVVLSVYVLNTVSVIFMKLEHALIAIPGHVPLAQFVTGYIVFVPAGFHPI